MKKHYKSFLIALNIVWAISALIYDWQEIAQLPPYLIPFLVICPIYPFLLAICWFRLLRGKSLPGWLLSFAAIPSIIYLIAAIIYYPFWMLYNNFDWLAFGQIFWVAFYGVQAVYFLRYLRPITLPVYLASLFVMISLWLQYSFKETALFDFSGFPAWIVTGIPIFLNIALFALLFSLKLKNKTISTPKP